MTVRNPEDMHAVFAEMFTRRDLEGLMSLYESDAILIPQPAQAPVRGHRAIREALTGFLALEARLTIQTDDVIKTGDVALLKSTWTLAGSGPDGTTTDMTHKAVEVVRHQGNGWRFVIDHPFGGD